MTNPILAVQTVTDDRLEALCRLLSHDIYQPSAIQILYFLLQPAVQHDVQDWGQLGQAIRETHEHNLQISAFGTLPDEHSLRTSNRCEENVWGVALVLTDEKFGEARARFWISTETNASPADNLNDQPKWQPDEQSLAVLDTMCQTFFRPFLQKNGGQSIFFNGTNQCWTKHLGALGNNIFDNACSKAVRRFDLHAGTAVECPPGYRIRPLEEKDIETVSSESPTEADYAD